MQQWSSTGQIVAHFGIFLASTLTLASTLQIYSYRPMSRMRGASRKDSSACMLTRIQVTCQFDASRRQTAASTCPLPVALGAKYSPIERSHSVAHRPPNDVMPPAPRDRYAIRTIPVPPSRFLRPDTAHRTSEPRKSRGSQFIAKAEFPKPLTYLRHFFEDATITIAA